ncbi:MAG: cell envelope integrity protein TolA [Shewanella psychromarinicola]|uniref:Cell envelope integrity protein TolA n=1 Tax=Shewanella psychromarinicola TaxID=2487742 RepID=A0A3N4DZI0_9GAMM|nr:MULTISPECIES: cell envelope integrity protein TolA [Shewanella]AZG35833.1 cell envelope integrity protein TolA [Shewanella psychromarinicola]MCL1083656.1 cell envelope integrity protein TolA [Shewanella psychromarinicola]PKG77138.1 cell envelope integrity protein TolA [Shewanella sp. Actino-trap-3]RPA22824.1 cell envelope integrity protein TolA [Shewanella psychromarinicola]
MAGKSDLTVPVSISAGIHIGFIVILALGISFDDKPKQMQTAAASAPAMQAIVIDQQKVNDRVEQLKKQKQDVANQEKVRQAELERKALEARREREREQDKIKTLEIQRKQKEQETQKANDAAKAAQAKQRLEKDRADKAEVVRKQKEQEQKVAEDAAKLASEKRKQEEAAAKKAQQERQRADDERKRKEEAERKRKAEADTKARQEREMAEAMSAEQDSLSKTRNRQVLSEVDKYKAMIIATIQRNLVVDESMRGKSCRVFIRLASDGFVTTSQTLDGDQVVCRAAKASINKAGRLPVSPEPAVYQQLKEINLTVSPEFN